MRKFFDLDNPLIVFLSRIADAVVLSLLWFVFSLPMITMGGATNAMRRAFREGVLEENAPLLKTFWEAFRKDWKKDIIVSIVYEAGLVIVLTVILGGYTYFPDAVWLGAVYLFVGILAVIWIGMMVFDFMLLMGRQLGVGKQLSVAFVLVLRHLPVSMIVIVLLAGAVMLSEIFPLFMMFLPAAFCWLTDKWFAKIENRYPDFLAEPMEGR